MTSLLLYLGMIVLGSIVGNKVMSREKEYKWVGKVQVVAIIVLIFTMGMRIGADERVVKSLKSIGLSAFVITLFTMTGSVLAVFLVRRLMKLDRRGESKDD